MEGENALSGRDGHVGRVAAYYDEWTAKYVAVFGGTIQAHRPTSSQDLHDYLLASTGIDSGQRILDAGCGICGPACHIAENRDVHIDALTISGQQAEDGRAYVQSRGLANRITTKVGDFHRLDELYAADSFNLVYFFESLSHSPDPRRVLEGVRHVLLPGGIVYIKDFFVRPCTDEAQRRRIERVVAKVDRTFVTKTARAPDIFDALWDLGFLPEFVRPPDFAVDNQRWQTFEATHTFDLFDGQDSFDWSQWLEFRFRKP